MIRQLGYEKYVSPSDLDKFIPDVRRNWIHFCFSEKDLNLNTGKKIISFIERLEKKNVNYHISADSLPKCIFDLRDRTRIKNFKIQKDILVNKCLRCIFFLRKTCNGAIKEKVMSREQTIFDILSINEILSLIKRNYSRNFDEILNNFDDVLNKMFEIKSANSKIIYWDYPKNKADKCDYDFIFHFIEAKLKLNKKEEVIKNKKLISILKNTYNEHKTEYIKKENLLPRDNRWTKLIIMMNWCNLLSEKDKEFWIRKYAYYKFTESEPKLPQAWNRIWVFARGLGILNINDLKKIKTVNFHKSKNIICSYIPEIQDVFKQNVFSEETVTMFSKYISIRRFCNKPIFGEIKYLLH